MTNHERIASLRRLPVISRRCSLESLVLSPKRRARLERRRFLKSRALKRLDLDLKARAELLVVNEQVEQYLHYPLGDLSGFSMDELRQMRGQAQEDVLTPREQHAAMLSCLGTFDGDRALQRHDRSCREIGQIDRELRSRGYVAA